MRPQTLLYRQLIGRTTVRPYTTNLDQPIIQTVPPARHYAAL
ncbi:MAG: hypothetical protein O7D93_08535 [Acidobacteria bacterium]|nr:hypothetical protein [Acidobacteriota bacterium]